jgi:hypothetical protein
VTPAAELEALLNGQGPLCCGCSAVLTDAEVDACEPDHDEYCAKCRDEYYAACRAKEEKPVSTAKTTAVDIVIRLQVAGSPADVATYRGALECLADIMCVQAEDGLWSTGHEDGETDDGPSAYVADIVSSHVQDILIDYISRREASS